MKRWRASEPFRMPPTFCPRCFQLLDATTNLTDEVAPVVGDFTVCIACSAVLCFTDNMALRLSSLSEVPLEIRAKFARVMYLAEEVKKGRGQ